MKLSFAFFAAGLVLASGLSFPVAASPKDWRNLIGSDSSRWAVESYQEGDLNLDGRKDVVAVTSKGETRRVWIFFKTKDGGYKRVEKTENWPGSPSIQPVGVLWTENEGDRVFKWWWDAGRNRFYLIEEVAAASDAKINYQTRKLTRLDPSERRVICRVDPKKSDIALAHFDPAKHSSDPSVPESCADPSRNLNGESLGYYPQY